jgi:hypothetical protein
MTWNGSERRAHRRYGVKGSIVRWRPGPPIGWVSPASPPHVLIDLSADGCHFVSKVRLRPGKRVSLLIEAPKAPVAARAAGFVAWSRRSEEHDAWETGIAMTPRTPAAAGRLKSVLDGAVLDRIEITTRHYVKERGGP